jgi:hypothetical protein
MAHKIKRLIFFVGIFLVFAFSVPRVSTSALSAEPKPNSVDSEQEDQQIEQAVLNAVANNSKYIQGQVSTNLQVSDIKISQDQQWATAWVVYYDPQIDAVIPTEPALAIVEYQKDHWEAYLPTDPEWESAMSQLPVDLLSQDEKEMWLTMNQGVEESLPTQTGYFLPWRGGQTASLSRSVGHDADFTTAHYAFDFYLPGQTVCPGGSLESDSGTTGLNFNIYASKGGTVWGWDDSVQDCDHSKVNFIVLRNIDDPSIFQLYMHLSHDSIPSALKSVGAVVGRGQFIAVADNTGNSTGSHLHFQIERQPTWPADNPYWNTALDVTFMDVAINGGRPRVSPLDVSYCRQDDVCNVFQQTYLSNNYFLSDTTPPTGTLNGVSAGQVINTSLIHISGTAVDDLSGLDYGQLIANFGGSWHNLGSHFNPGFSFTWDLCDPITPVADGPISIAMFLYDLAGNPAPRAGLVTIIKNFSCPTPPPTCLPANDQVTLFEDPYYQGGCVKFDIGEYPSGQSLNPLGNDDADSIIVGKDVNATLFSDENYSGHSQVITGTLAYMQYGWVPANTLSSMVITPSNQPPKTPIPVNPRESSLFREGDVIPLTCRNASGATEYRFELYYNSSLYKAYAWQSEPVRYIDSLAEGSYTWRVQGKNNAGMSPWSQIAQFTIGSPIITPPEKDAPYSDTMENDQSAWVRDGLWRIVNSETMAHSGVYSWWYQNEYGDYDNGQPNSGSLTSPPISIPNIGYILRFYYRYQTESSGKTWDQRWVQISVDGGPYVNLMELTDDPQMPETSSWLTNKSIDLSPYSGHNVRIRFYFSTLDAVNNNYSGWGIDDFSIAASAPTNCGEDRQDDTPESAFLLTYDPAISIPGEICPNGDYDYYRFYGNVGDRIVADVDAMVYGSPLDSYLYLLAPDKKTVLAENDDEVYADLRDPLISYTLPKDGVYYLKLKAWKHPLVGGADYTYKIRLYEDHLPPVLALIWPTSNTYLPDTEMTLSVNTSDLLHGMNRVEFYWHPADWYSGSWQLIGTDRDGSDGWSMVFNPSGQLEGKSAAIFVQGYDNAGHSAGSAAWNLVIDKTPPTTHMNSLSPSQPSNAFLLSWTGADNLSGIEYVEIQEKIGAENWTTFPAVDGSIYQYWIIGNPGSSYSYRMRGVDRAGNSENYPVDAETTTSIPEASVMCFAPDSFDTSGNDNSPANASLIYANGASQYHNYCNPIVPNYQSDEDWIKLLVSEGQHILVQSIATSLPSATVISLYAGDGTTLLAEASPAQFGKNTILVWTSDRNSEVYLRLKHLDGRVIGNDVGSTVSVKTGGWTFLPVVHR